MGKERKFRVYDIDWDVEDSDMTPAEMEEIKDDLPEEITITFPNNDSVDPDDTMELEDYIVNGLSDKYGFCVNGYKYEEISMKTIEQHKEELLSKIQEIFKQYPDAKVEISTHDGGSVDILKNDFTFEEIEVQITF